MRQFPSWLWSLLDVVLLTLVSLLAAIAIHDGFGANLGYPLAREAGDSTFYASHVFKASLDNPWYLHNQFLNAPAGLDMHDFPCPDLVALGFIKLCVLFTSNWALVENLYYLTSFPFSTLAAFGALRHLGVRRAVAMAASLAFAFLSYHQMRGFHHILFGCTYWQAPLTAVLCVWLGEGREVLVAKGKGLLPRVLRDRASLTALALALVVGVTGMFYYPFFSLGCVVCAAISGALFARSVLPLVRGGIVIGTIGVGLVANLLPTILYQRSHGGSAVILRSPADAEIFGLKLTELVLPFNGHRIPTLSRWRYAYDSVAPLVNENVSAYLGMVGVVAFGFVGWRLFFPSVPRRSGETDEAPTLRRIDLLARVAAFCFLLGTIGGIGSLVSFTVFNKVRSYNRISPFVAFFCLAALAIVVERALLRVRSAAVARALTWGVAPLVGAFAIWEQSFEVRRDWPELNRRHDATRSYFEAVEAAVPPGGAVFSVPYVSFPEAPRLHKMVDYEQTQPYLFTTRLKYSYPSMLGRPDSVWKERIASTPIDDLPDAVALNGFDGLLVYRFGFPDDGELYIRALTAKLGPPMESPDGRNVFFSLVEHRKTALARLGPEAGMMAAYYRNGPFLSFPPELFAQPETLGDRRWRWSLAPKASFVIQNPLDQTLRLELTAEAQCVSSTPRWLKLSSPTGWSETYMIDRKPTRIVHRFDVPPGAFTIELETDAPRVEAPGDPRTLYMQLFEPNVRLVRGE